MGWIDDFLSLVYPVVCSACGKGLYGNEEVVCTLCMYHLPKTNFHLDQDNPVARLFWGKVRIHSATAFYRFEKGGKVQRLVHNLKYRGQKEVGTVIGRNLAFALKESEKFNAANAIVPVPLHPKKLAARGYNQSDFFALGLSEILGAELITGNLKRVYATESQTRKARFERWKNVGTVFTVANPDKFRDKHVLLVDDVITTGSTLESSAKKILEIPGTRVSIAAIAYASH
jgi:ComF family protein